MSTKIAIAGAMGRMGQNLIKSGLKNDKTEIVGVFDIENIDKNFLISVGLQSGIATNRETLLKLLMLLSILHLLKLYSILLSQLLPIIQD